jgi:hypothetical protein
MRETAAILICLLLQTGCTSTRNLQSALVQDERLQQLRHQHQQARDNFAQTQDYGDDYRQAIDTGHALISALLSYWVALPEGSTEAPALRQEIKALVKETGGNPLTERHNIEKSFLARGVWPLLADEPTSEQAAFLAELTKPQMGVRMNDRRARAGKPTEPLGWDVQAAHALALIRSGDDERARDEIDILHDKVSINHARNPKGQLDYGLEAGAARYRNYTDYLQLCEILRALQAALSNDPEGAKTHIANAVQLREVLSPEATPLATEVHRRVKLNERR